MSDKKDKHLIDQKKRKTLKALSVSAGVLASGTLGGAAVASISDIAAESSVRNADAAIHVATRLSVVNNDLEIVLTNASDKPVRITQIAPERTRVARGEFGFSALFKNGPVLLDGGASVSVPLQRKPVSLVTNPGYAATSLTDTLRKSMVVTTEGDLLAQVSVKEFSSIA